MGTVCATSYANIFTFQLNLTKFIQNPILPHLSLQRWATENKETTLFKDTHREKTPSNKTLALTKSTIMDIWVIGTPNQLIYKRFLNWKKIYNKVK